MKRTNKNRIISFFAVLIFLVSCKKQPAIEIDAKFHGSWRHKTGENSYVYLYIQSNSRGEIERYEDGMTSGTINAKWLIKKNKLYLGWLASKNYKFEINKYPTIADTTLIHNFDSVPIGSMYIILDGDYYVD